MFRSCLHFWCVQTIFISGNCGASIIKIQVSVTKNPLFIFNVTNIAGKGNIQLMHSFEVNIKICQPEKGMSTEAKPSWTSLSRVDKS